MSVIVSTILETFWLFLPAGVANVVPVLAARYHILSTLARPIHEETLGKHKTWRGVILGIIFGSIASSIQYFVYPAFPYLTLPAALSAGAALGAGALLGDIAKSFFKRRLQIPPGRSWPPFDQIDFIVGALMVAGTFFPLTFTHIAVAVVMYGIFSWLTSAIGVILKIKSSL